MSAPNTAAAVLRGGVDRLIAAGIASAAVDCRALLADAMGVAPDRLTLRLQDEVPATTLTRFAGFIAARARHQPVAQIIGKRLFWKHSFIVTTDTLDPRPETEVLVAEALRAPFLSVLDLGTGTGCILLSLLTERPTAIGVGADISNAALDVARRNAADLGVAARAELVPSNWFTSIGGKFDMIVSNPPYIAHNEMVDLSPDVRLWEPHLALTDGGDGLSAYRAIAAGAVAHLNDAGRILLEIGPTQGAAVSMLLAEQGLHAIRILQDFDGRDRVVVAQNFF